MRLFSKGHERKVLKCTPNTFFSHFFDDVTVDIDVVVAKDAGNLRMSSNSYIQENFT